MSNTNGLEDIDLKALLAEREKIMRQLAASNEAINSKQRGEQQVEPNYAPPPLPPAQPVVELPKPPEDNPKAKRKATEMDQSQESTKLPRKTPSDSHFLSDNRLPVSTPLEICVGEVRRSVKNPMLLTASHLLSPDENISQCDTFASSPVFPSAKSAPSAGPYEHSSYDDLNISVDSDCIFGISDGADRLTSSSDLDFATDLLTPDSYEKDESTLRSTAILHHPTIPSYKPDGFGHAYDHQEANFHADDILFGNDLMQGRNFEVDRRHKMDTPSPQPVVSSSPTPASSRSLSPAQFPAKEPVETDSDPNSQLGCSRRLIVADESDEGQSSACESALNDLQSAAMKILSADKADDTDDPMESSCATTKVQSSVDGSALNGPVGEFDEDESVGGVLDDDRLALTELGVLPEDFDPENLNEEDIDALLERPMKDYDTEKSKWSGLKEPPTVRDKIVIKHRGTEYFEVLPDGWIEITHSSGVPIYLHKATRVCTLSRPYFIGPGSARHHDVPLASVPCLYQQKVQSLHQTGAQPTQNGEVLKETAKTCPYQNDINVAATGNSGAEQKSTANGGSQRQMPEVKVQTAEEFKERNLNPSQLHDYCKKVFEFETIKVWRFRNWSDHRIYHRKQRQKKQRPALPANVKLITVPALEKSGKPTQKQFFLNPHGKTSVCLLHEYVQRVMHCSPIYEYSETENASNPYSATVMINGTRYATGFGNSKKNAKLDAARRTLAVLIPDVDFSEDSTVKLPNQDDVLELFDLFEISDSRVFELSTKAGQPTPYQILLECLKRNAAFGDTQMENHIKMIKHQQHEYTMKVGKHQVKVLCTNKREGKQKASQAMLEKLHPHIKTWGSLIRLYGYGSQRKAQEPPGKELTNTPSTAVPSDKATEKSSGGKFGLPNRAILEKLKKEMSKLHEDKKAGISGVAADAAMVGEAIKSINI